MGFLNNNSSQKTIAPVAKSQGCVFNAHCLDAIVTWTCPKTSKQYAWARMNDNEFIRLFDIDLAAIFSAVRFTPFVLSNDYFYEDVDADFFDKSSGFGDQNKTTGFDKLDNVHDANAQEDELLSITLRCDAVDFVHRLHVPPVEGYHTYQLGMHNGELHSVFSTDANLADAIFQVGQSSGPFMHPTYIVRDLDDGERCWSTQLRVSAIESGVCHRTDVAFPGVCFVTAWMRNGSYFERLQVLGVDTNALAVNTLFGGTNMQAGVCSSRMKQKETKPEPLQEVWVEAMEPIQIMVDSAESNRPGFQAKLFNRRRLGASDDPVEAESGSESDWDDFNCGPIGQTNTLASLMSGQCPASQVSGPEWSRPRSTFFKNADQWC